MTNSKKQTNHNNKIPKSKQLTAYPQVGNWDLEFAWNLVLGIWNFSVSRTETCRIARMKKTSGIH
jgi:hypothetical protein